MKVVELSHYGSNDNLKIKEIEKPKISDNEVLIKVHASTITRVDSIFRLGNEFFAKLYTGLTKPKIKILGTELSGEIVDIGKNVAKFKIGDKVFAACDAAHAEFVALNENDAIALMPGNLSFSEAAAVPAGTLTALPFLRDSAKIKSGDKVLINGASGSIGSYAVQLAKYFGAEVTAVSSAANAKMLLDLGADFHIDYKSQDFTENLDSYDIIFDTVGKSSFGKANKALKKGGRYMNPVINFPILLQSFITTKFTSKKAVFVATGLREKFDKQKDLKFIGGLLKNGTLKVIIDKCYKLVEIEKAYQHVDHGHKKGNVVIEIGAAE